MGFTCGQKLCKAFMILINALFIVAGIAMIAAGAVVKVALAFGNNTSNGTCTFSVSSPLDSLKGCYDYLCGLLGADQQGVCTALSNFPIGIVILGAFVFILAILGCCGAVKENRCLLVVFFIIVFVLTVAQAAVAIAAFAFTGNFITAVQVMWTKMSTSQRESIERVFDCCGLSAEVPSPVIPCASPVTADAGYCQDVIASLISSNVAIFAGVGVAVVFIEISGLVSSCCVRAGASKKKEEEKQGASANPKSLAYASSV
mmetsp:Transcript_37336/g.96525  ORF Transcript_37336/g.96525 Transcript_37336/m.96525 type:complete len:259 (-) Transcript_37336:567-1343(-)